MGAIEAGGNIKVTGKIGNIKKATQDGIGIEAVIGIVQTNREIFGIERGVSGEGRPARKVYADRQDSPNERKPYRQRKFHAETRIYGRNVCYTVMQLRPNDIIRAYVVQDAAPRYAAIMKFMAAEKRAYRLVDPGEMEKITRTSHHEGICLLVRRRPPLKTNEYLRVAADRKTDMVVGLEYVNNPHNLGAIARVCAHFGVGAIFTEDDSALQSGAAMRTSEGGVELVEIVTGPMMDAVERFREDGYTVVGTSNRAEHNVFESALPEKTLLLFGSEAQGMTDELAAACDFTVRIPGAGKVDSLNVSCAASVVLGNWWSDHCSETAPDS